MTEQEWLTSNDPVTMLRWLTADRRREAGIFPLAFKPATDRQLRLFTNYRQHWTHPWSPADILRDIFGNPWKPVSRTGRVLLGERSKAEINQQAMTFVIGPASVFLEQPAMWLTSTVLSLAEAIYNDRAFERMPVLGDALEDAGCTEESILRHCRGEEQCGACGIPEIGDVVDPRSSCGRCNGSGWRPLSGPHVRGCWVVDLILGKTSDSS